MAEKKNKPEIRFKGFSEEWERREFKSVATRVSSISEKIGLPRVEYEDIISCRGELNKNIYQKESSKIGIEFDNGDVLFGKLRPYLKNWLLSSFKGIAVGDFWVLRANETDSKFIYCLIQTLAYEMVANQSSGTKMPRSDWNLVSKTEFNVPIVRKEQSQIGTFFTHLDHLITIHQRKYDKLVTVKKAMLEKMFPKDGAVVPEIRFKGFSEDWEERKLGEVTDSYSGGTPSVGNVEFYGGEIPFIRSAEINSDSTEIFLTEKGLNNSSAKLVNKGYILYALYGATSGEVGRSKIKGAINQAVMAIIAKNDYDAEFIMQWLRKNKQDIISTYLQGGQGNLSGTIVKDLNIDFPCYDEQTKIGTFFNHLDTLITLRQRELEKLKNIKKACLEKMFV
jgi:type I restriction enzyme S subunit